ncbi:hypothetical protein B484DRAFT_252378 [Ochromonadaceae sp. CCMP2298]|nr:hypothetical protein B484DRAFT_252378 [Ochromonadaceae sp. CCMP2298]
MLNTDHHRVNMDKKKKCSKMTRDQFLNQLRGCDQGGDIDRAYLERIYDNVEATAIELQIGKE